jgi:mannose-1-phosphate guanylyltransferase
MLHAVVMAGGTGTRFWPASRRQVPKQLLDLAGEQTMIQSTVARFDGLVPPDRMLVVTNAQLVAPIRAQLPQLPMHSVLGEPCKRDTAPCVGVAAAWVARHDPDAMMVVTPADHAIQPVARFQMAMKEAVRLVEQQPDRLITFGISPTYPAESFGYIQRAARLEDAGDVAAYDVARFREKPSAEVAQQYLDDGNFYWNSGIFVWKARTILDQLEQHEPEMSRHIAAIARAFGRQDFDEVFRDEFAAIVGKSIDYAVMERAEHVVVLEAPFAWDDVGSWQALSRLRGKDSDSNTVVGRHLAIDTRGSIIRSEGEHLIVTVGMQDCLVVHTPNATLVAPKDQEERIREVVKQLEARGWEEYL